MFGTLRVSGTVEVGDRAELAASQGGEMVHAMAVATIAPAAADAVSIVRDPADVPPPVEDRGPMTHRVDMGTGRGDGRVGRRDNVQLLHI